MKMKKCELCNSIARMYCDSDKASLCWDCDARVHDANFLVAKHSRTLLCHSCQSPTPWTGSGSRLGHTLSVCHTCAIKDSASHSRDHHQENDDDPDEDGDDEEDEDEDDDEDDDDDDDDDDEGENQVVPLSSSPMNRPVISDSSTRSEEESSSRVFSGFNTSGIGFSWRSLH